MSATQQATRGDTAPRTDPIILWQVGVGIAMLAAWEASGRFFGTQWTSEPSLIAARLAQWAQGELYLHFITTLTEVVTGLCIGSLFGILPGLVLGRSPLLSVILRPIIVAFYSVPLIALAPLFIMFFGLDMLPKIVLVTIVVFFLLFFNTFAGAQSVDHDLIAQVELMGSNAAREVPEGGRAGLHGVDRRRHQDRPAVCAGGRHHRRDAGGAARAGLPAERCGVAVRHDVAVRRAVHPDDDGPGGLRDRRLV